MELTVSLDDSFRGDTVRRTVDSRRGVFVDLDPETGRAVKFAFSGHEWTDDKAKKFMRNRKLNKVYFRELGNGKIYMNTLFVPNVIGGIACASSTKDTSEVEKILGSEKFGKLCEIENKHGYEKPFIVDIIAMEFGGKDTVIGNGLRFFRDKTLGMMKKFAGIPVHPGHLELFESHKDRIGNTVGAYEGEDGNPHVYTYIWPHGKAGEYREGLIIAEAQGLLDTYRVSMFGNPDEYTLIEEGDKDYGKVKADIHSWTPQSQDFVFEEAIQGSKAIRVVNNKDDGDDEEIVDSKTQKQDVLHKKGGSRVTITEILEALREYDAIALSDLLTVPCVVKAIEGHEETIKKKLRSDEDFAKEIISNCDGELFLKDERVVKIVNAEIKKRNEKLDNAADDISKVAENAKVDLTEDQLILVKMNLTGEETEEQLLKMVQSASMFTNGLSPKIGFFEKKETKAEDKKEDEDEVSTKEVSSPQYTI